MAPKTLDQSYKQIKEQSRYTWRVMSSTLVPCVSAAAASFNIFVISKFFSAFALLPFEEGARGVEIRKARMSLTDAQITNALAKQRVYNWTRCTKPVLAIVVPGDGNSLCHAVAVHICGLIDQVLFFRRCLKNNCEKQSDTNSPLFFRWKHYTTQQCEQLGKTWTEESLERGWSNICRDAFVTPVEMRSQKKSQSIYSPLSKFHVFVMAQICRRPIVVVGLEINDFKPSVYLPIMIPVKECIHCPIYLAYNKGHFAPLVTVDEASTETRFRDLCIPITDKEFKQFEFPYLLEDEDGMSLLKLYVNKTDIVYTTSHDIFEVPAVRLPENKSSAGDSVINPNSFFEICFERLRQGGGPADVFNLWKYILELHSTFEDELPVGFTFDYAVQPISSSYQPESEAEDDADVPTRNSRSLASSSRTSENLGTSSAALTNENQGSVQGHNSNPDDGFDETIASRTVSNAETCLSVNTTVHNSEESGYRSEDRSESLQEHQPSSCTSEESISHMYTGPPSERFLPESSRNDMVKSHVHSHSEGNEDIESDLGEDFTEVDTDGDIYSSDQVSEDGVSDAAYSRSLSSGVTVQCRSNSQVRVLNCKNLSFTVLKLTSPDGLMQVSVTLEKDGLKDNDKIKLSFPRNSQLDVQYTHKIGDVLDLKLTKLQDYLYRLHINLPNTVISGQSTSEENLSDAMAPVNDGTDSAYVDMEDHPNKCRTAGCNGRAIRRYRYLCGSCHQAWREMLNLNAESTASFSYLDSVTSVENTNNGQCAISTCTNQGEERFYGFCETCFNTPGI